MTDETEHETTEPQDPVEAAIAAQMGDDEAASAGKLGGEGGVALSADSAAELAAEPTDEPDDGPEPEPEPKPEPGSEAVSEEIGKKLDKVQKYVAGKMGDILGEDAALFEVCEVCSYTNTPGWRLSGPYPPDVEAAVRGVLGQHAMDEYKIDNYSAVCTACDGQGSTISRSKVQGQELLVCYDCKGRGWMPVGPERGGVPLVAANGGQLHNQENGETYDVIDVKPQVDSPEVALLKQQGYIIIPPTALTA